MSLRSIGDVRPSQVITTFGPGAVVDLKTMSVIVAGTDEWLIDEDSVIHEKRLQRALRVDRFFTAQPAEGSFGRKKGTVPTYLFPRFQVCTHPKCNTLSEYGVEDLIEYREKWQEFVCKAPGCPGRGKFKAPTIPAPFITACPSGHIDDFPWRYFVHRGPTDCTKRLKLYSRGKSGTISDLMVACQCGAKRPMGDAFGLKRQDALPECSRRRPWLGTKNVDQTCNTKDDVRAMLRGATNGWFPILRSTLRIKEAATPLTQAIEKCSPQQIQKIDTRKKLDVMLEMEMLPSLAAFQPDEIWTALEKERGNTEQEDIDLRFPEWQAFRDPAQSSQGDKSDFFLETAEVPKFVEDSVQTLIQVRKLLEVRALTSFTRIDYVSGQDDDGVGDKRAPISRQRKDWLPAVEVRGEGLFLELNEDKLQEWEARKPVQARANAMEEKYRAWANERGVDADDFPGARYVLLHTLAHVLIRQLSLDCGYSASSVRERLYSSTDNERRMAGVLLYTASPDSEGSLGGLVDLGSKERFPDLLHNALRGAKRCSSDPLCASHTPDVHATINGAACHACVLVPETSCESFNRFLDRNFLVPTMAHDDMAFFEDV